MGPLSHVISIKGPKDVQLSFQKLQKIPEPISQMIKGQAKDLNFHNLFQIQLPATLESKSQKQEEPIKCLLIQETHKEPPPAKIIEISLSPKTLFQARSLLSPNPPLSVGVQADSQLIFALLAELGALFPHKKPHTSALSLLGID